jgi:hypothetical protein
VLSRCGLFPISINSQATMKKASFSASIKRPRRCVCSKCAACVENERWERIFQQKYGQQERDYYAERREPRSSGVSAKAFSDTSIYACTDEQQPSAIKSPEERNIRRIYDMLRKARFIDAEKVAS